MQRSDIKTQYLHHGKDAGHKYFTGLNSATRSISIWCYFATFTLRWMHLMRSYKRANSLFKSINDASC